MKIVYALLIAFGLFSAGYAQNVGIGIAVPASRLDVNGAINLRPAANINGGTASTLPSNVSTAEVVLVAGGGATTIAAPVGAAPGQLLYITNRDDNPATFAGLTAIPANGAAVYIFQNGAWREVSTTPGTVGWYTTGNNGTTGGTNFLGTIDNQRLDFRTFNAIRMTVDAGGPVGIGLTNPGARLTVRNNGTDPGAIDDGKALFVSGAFNAGTAYDGGVEFRHDNLTQGIGFGYSTIYATGTNAAQQLNLMSRGGAPITLQAYGTGANVGIGTATPNYQLELTGSFGYGNVSGVFRSRTETRDNVGLQGNAGAQSGFFETSAPAPAANWPAGAASWWHVIDARHSNAANNYAMQIAGSFFDQDFWVRKTNGAANTPWSRMLTSNNGWMTTGNAGTTAGTNFIGTTDAVRMDIRTSNAIRMTVDAAGSVGIGTTAPTYRLTVAGGGNVFGVDNTATFVARNSGGGYEAYMWPRWSDNVMYMNYGSGGFNIRNNGSATAMFMTPGLNVGIRSTNPQVPLAINGNGTNVYGTDAWVENNMHVQGNEGLVAGGRGRLRVGTAWNYAGLYADASSTGAGNDLVLGASSAWIRVGADGSNQNFRVDGWSYHSANSGSLRAAWGRPWGWCNSCWNIGCFCTSADCGWCGSNHYLYIQTPGSVEADEYFNISDRRYKKDIADIPNALGIVMGLRGVTYNRKMDLSETDSPQHAENPNVMRSRIGFLAQEVQQILPQAVAEFGDEDPNDPTLEQTTHLSVNYRVFVPILVEAMQEQQTQIEAMRTEHEQEVDALKKQVEELRQMMLQMQQQQQNGGN